METFILKKNTILYRSSVDICKMFNKNLNEFKEKCEDTNKEGLYFSDSVMVPFGMSFEYLDKYQNKKNSFPGGAFKTEEHTKNTYFINHQIGKFIVTEDITLYVGKYSFRSTKLGGKGFEDYIQKPTKNYNHIDKIRAIIGDEDPIFKSIFNVNKPEFNEYFIGYDRDLKKIKLEEDISLILQNLKNIF